MKKGSEIMFKEKESKIIFLNTLTTGFFGGIFLSCFHIAINFFNISKVNHEMILNHFYFTGNWIMKWYGYLFYILFIALLSILFAIIYYLLFRKIRGWIVGFIYGIILWLIFGLTIPLVFYDISISELITSRTNVASICLFILYGVFIGYSISYDYEITAFDQNTEATN